jgi:cyclohexanecarboxylate-CoA ligase
MTVTLMPTSEEVSRYRRGGLWTEELIDGFLSAVVADPAAAAQPAIVDGDLTITYAELERHVAAIAGALHGLDVRKGDVVSWQLPNWWEAVALHYAILRCGAVSNPIVPIHRRRGVEFILRQAETKVFVHPAEFRRFDYQGMVAEMKPQLPHLKHTVVVRGEEAAGLSFQALLSGEAAPHVDRTAFDPAVLMYTSGTTADPKGVVHPHATLVCENRGIIRSWGFIEADRIFMPSLLAHITGLLYGIQLPSMLGTMVVLQDVWEPKAALRLIERHRCTFVVAATPFLHALLSCDELDQRDITSLRSFMCGGADVPPQLIRQAEARLEAIVARGYGSTEYPTATQGWIDASLDSRADTDGRPAEWTELRVVDDVGAELPVGERGELLVRGPERFIGYLVPPPGEQVFDADGWFATGDMARLDSSGYLTIEGRKKDIILRGGENISAKEVEDHLLTHPKIADVAVVAMPDPVMVERACAFIVAAEDDAPTLRELADYLLSRGLAIQKAPERLELLDELPKNSAGKVEKARLREHISALLASDGPNGTKSTGGG